jgi:acetone carboxylase gamma subunit
MSTYLVVEFPNLDIAKQHYFQAREFFSTRCSCLGRSETNPICSFMIFKDDVNETLYETYKTMLPNTASFKEVVMNS